MSSLQEQYNQRAETTKKLHYAAYDLKHAADCLLESHQRCSCGVAEVQQLAYDLFDGMGMAGE